ncbi:hypothetical protein JVU11DRAFT_7985 [Chiua virens]|nr:hypothetical protein JVU11DRAFT_7985 [Chiua virens]
MLRIRSLAAVVHVDPGWLLNHAELSRVCWHQGATEGVIVVEGDSFNLPVVSSLPEGADSVPSAEANRIELVKIK